MRNTLLLILLLGSFGGKAAAFSEEKMYLRGMELSQQGDLSVDRVAGFYCETREDAETISRYLNAPRTNATSEMMFARCIFDEKVVLHGAFPSKQHPVVFVNVLPSRSPQFVVVGVPDSMNRTQEARRE